MKPGEAGGGGGAHAHELIVAADLPSTVTVTIGQGGTGVSSLSKFKTSMSIDKIDNTLDIDKPISNKTQAALDIKLNSIDTNFLLRKSLP